MSVSHAVVDGFEQALAVDDGDDEYLVVVDAIDEPVAVDEALADVLVVELRYDTRGEREVGNLARALEDFGDDTLGIEGGVSGDVAGDVVDVGERLG